MTFRLPSQGRHRRRGNLLPAGVWLAAACTLCVAAWQFDSPRLAWSAELVRLSEATWEQFAPGGKEIDCIYGDFVLRNDRLIAVVADPLPTRNANMTVRAVGGCLIDLTRRDANNDQLSCYYPTPPESNLKFVAAGVVREDGSPAPADDLSVPQQGPAVVLICRGQREADGLLVEVVYRLADGQDYIEAITTYANDGDRAIAVALADAIRADRTFERSPPEPSELFWANDRFFRQGYGLLVKDHRISHQGNVIRLHRTGQPDGENAPKEGEATDALTLPPGESYRVERRLIPGNHLFEVLSTARQLQAEPQFPAAVRVLDEDMRPVVGAEITAYRRAGEATNEDDADDNDSAPRETLAGHGHSGQDGRLSFELPAGTYRIEVSDIGRTTISGALQLEAPEEGADDSGADGPRPTVEFVLDQPGFVEGRIVNAAGGPTPCKVQFRGRGETADPDFGPDSGEIAVKNLYYSHTGAFRQPIAPGSYDVIVSYGPEHDAVFTQIDVRRGAVTPIEARLVRSVNTPGWVSADFHNHSTPSGDNTSSQFGRVLNILCEHIEYAPCTEHNRISTYVPHLKRLGVEHLVATCSGIELTGSPLPINHQNAFPLIHKPRTQDGGGPTIDVDPEEQISRLALWDNNSEKLVQQNHPDIGWLFFDKNGDGIPDGGFKKSLPYIDVIEVHPIDAILKPAVYVRRAAPENNRLLNWLQLLNQGRRLPGVVNTDSHYNFHESGFWRNYIKSPADDPARIDTMDIVRASERGQILLTTAPFLELTLTAAESPPGAAPARGGIGDDLEILGGKCLLHVRVQCANWYDIDRVQVYLNGRPDPKLNFTRDSHSEKFAGGAVKFDQQIPLELQGDAHVMVLAVGEKSTLGPVMGPVWGRLMPAALSNPIYVDVDGGGFQANGDTLGAPLPVKSGTRPAEEPGS